MFSRESLIGYFGEIYTLEREMEEQYEHVTEKITHREYREIFQRLAREERGHQRLVNTIIEMIGKPGRANSSDDTT